VRTRLNRRVVGRAWLLVASIVCAASAAAQAFDPAPWAADLEQARRAFHEKYANLDWLEREREVRLDPLFDDLAKRLQRAQSEAQTMSVFNRLVQKVDDGHVEIDWPEPQAAIASAGSANTSSPSDLCSRLGYDIRQNAPGTAQALAGYVPLSVGTNPFDAGTVIIDRTKIGILRIGIFQPQGYPELCHDAVRRQAIPLNQPCDEICENRIVTSAYRRLTQAVEQRIGQLKSAGATLLLVDISHNGGGSEWAEAVARMFSARQLVSERRGFVRGEHWATQWADLSNDLREFAKSASGEDRRRLLAWAAEADTALKDARTTCPVTTTACSRIPTAGYSTGLVGSARSGTFDGKDWGALIFSPAQFPYHDGTWDGPLIVLTDQETWSAAEEFAAVLQDNKAAVILGARTGGAGCGHTNGGTPTTLKNSGAVLELPDCVRFRADGSNEVRGIVPDVPVAIRANDGVQFRAALILEKLPEAVARAKALQRR